MDIIHQRTMLLKKSKQNLLLYAWELGGFIMETQGITNVELGLG